MHGDEGHLVSGRVLLFLAFLIQGDPRQKLIESVHGLAKKLRDSVGQQRSGGPWGGCHVREQSLWIVLQVHRFGRLLGGDFLALLATGLGGQFAVQIIDEFLDVAHPVVGHVLVFFGPAQVCQITGFLEPMIGPVAQANG